MIDLGQTFFEENRHFFSDLSVHQIIVNPSLKGYPPVFLLCREIRGKKDCEYILAATFLQLNKLLMNAVDNRRRLLLAERLAEALIPGCKTDNIDVAKLIGGPLRISGLDMTTRLRKFFCDIPEETPPLYYFQLTEM